MSLPTPPSLLSPLSRRQLGSLGLSAAALSALSVGPASAQATEVTRTNLQTRPMPGSGQELRLDLIVFPGGAATPPHRHPFAGLNYVVEGAAETAYGNDAPHIYRAGASFQDEAGRVHTLFRNADSRAPLRFLITYVVDFGQSYLLFDGPAPASSKP